MGKFESLVMRALIFFFAVVYVFELARPVAADTGVFKAGRTAEGNAIETSTHSVTTTAKRILADRDDRPTATCINNGTVEVWIGSSSIAASLLSFGFPILSSSTFKVNSLSAPIWATTASGTTDVRCVSGVTQ